MMVEALACGTPVIAFGRGGARDILTAETGVFFEEQTVASMIDAVERFETMSFSPLACRANAERFSQEVFRVRMGAVVDAAVAAGVRG